eukprot:SAG11_NODE_8650_length_991_cov_0.995516_1_plen_32_part_10
MCCPFCNSKQKLRYHEMWRLKLTGMLQFVSLK